MFTVEAFEGDGLARLERELAARRHQLAQQRGDEHLAARGLRGDARVALLEAEVNFQIVRNFIARVRSRALRQSRGTRCSAS